MGLVREKIDFFLWVGIWEGFLEVPLCLKIAEDASEDKTGKNKFKKIFLEHLVEIAGDYNNVKCANESEFCISYSNDLGMSDNHTETTNNILDDLIRFDNDKLIITIPVKLFVSLPLNKNNSPDNALLIPDMLQPTNDTNNTNNINLLTVGGVEHNRPLMQIINQHKKKHKEERLFGFMDNVFDFQHYLSKHSEDGFQNMYLMGVNMPVSGINNILSMRFDKDGLSSNCDAKLLFFKIEIETKINEQKSKKQLYNIVSIYGYSAIASNLAQTFLLHRLIDRHQLFNDYLNEDDNYEIDTKGECWLLRFKNEDIFKFPNNLFHSRIILEDRKEEVFIKYGKSKDENLRLFQDQNTTYRSENQ